MFDIALDIASVALTIVLIVSAIWGVGAIVDLVRFLIWLKQYGGRK